MGRLAGRLVGLVMVLGLVGAACGDTATEETPAPTDAPAAVDDATTTTTPPTTQPPATTQPPTTTQPPDNARGLADAGPLVGDVTFSSILGAQTFTDGFELGVLAATRPPGAPDTFTQDAVTIGDYFTRVGVVDLGSRDAYRLGQLRPGFEVQNTWGLLGDFPDGSLQGVSIGRADTHLEIYILDFEVCDGFLDTCSDVIVTGYNFIFSPDADLEEALETAGSIAEDPTTDRGLFSLEPISDFFTVGDFTVSPEG